MKKMKKWLLSLLVVLIVIPDFSMVVLADPPAPSGIPNAYPVTSITDFYYSASGQKKSPPYLVTNRISYSGTDRFYTTTTYTNKLNIFRSRLKTGEKVLGPTVDGNWKPPSGYKIVEKIEYPVYEYRTYPVSVKDCIPKAQVKFGISESAVGTCHPTTFEPGRDVNQWAVDIGFANWQYRDTVIWRGSPHYEWAAMEYEDQWFEYKYAKIAPPTNGLEVRPDVRNVLVGESTTYQAFLTKADGTEQNVTSLATWTTANSKIGSLTGKGKYKGVKVGTTTVKASYSGFSDTATLNVTEKDVPPPKPPEPPSTLEITPPVHTIMVGESAQYEAYLVKGDGTRTNVTQLSGWLAGDRMIGSQTAPGKFLGQTNGSTSITVKYNDLSASAVLNVDKPNIPPVAIIQVAPEYYWPETVTVDDQSYDIDGQITQRDFRIDNKTSPMTTTFPRVTEPQLHNASLTVTDDGLLSDSTSKQFKILPTTPTALLELGGTLKVNRTVTMDATVSDSVTKSIKVAPINYDLTEWTIEPVTEGITAADIKIASVPKGGNREVLFKKAGDYKVSITIYNKYKETATYSKVFTIVPDEPPIASFEVDQRRTTRVLPSKEATFTLTDRSTSPDNDIIKQRIWYVEYDSNNDGLFGTLFDQPRQVISSQNETTVKFKSDKVGKYRFNLEVVEDFGQPTLLQFIQPSDYLRDITDPIAPIIAIGQYQLDENFNLPGKDVGVEIINTPPIIDFGVKSMKKIDVVIDVSGLDIATLQHDRTSFGTNDRYYRRVYQETKEHHYDHYYYTYDTVSKNAMKSLVSDLQTNLRAKGIDANVLIDDRYFHVPDSDGKAEISKPIWGTTEWYTYNYDSVTTTNPYYSPPPGWRITGSSMSGSPAHSNSFSPSGTASGNGTQSYLGGDKWQTTSFTWAPEYYGIYVSDGIVGGFCPIKNSSLISSNKGGSGAGYNVGDSKSIYETHMVNYSCSFSKPDDRVWYYSIEQAIYNSNYEIQYFETKGNNSTEQVDTTDSTQFFAQKSYRPDASKYYVKLDSQAWTWMNTPAKKNLVVNEMNAENLFLWNYGVNTNKLNAENLILSTTGKGKYSQFTTNYALSDKTIEDYFINEYMRLNDPENLTILLGDEVDYTVVYQDQENDPEIAREWKFNHDATKVNGRVIDNQTGQIAQHDTWINSPLQLPSVGTYKIQLRAKDNPVYWNDSRFAEYQKWSDETIVREYTINVHRKPIADFKFSIDAANSFKITLDPTTSWDPEHQFNRSDKGIVEYKWDGYTVDGVSYAGKVPDNLQPGKVYTQTLQVKDIDGAYGIVTKVIDTNPYNIKPIAHFTVQSEVFTDTVLDFADQSYDPNGDPLTDYQITIRKQGSSTILQSMSTFPTSFEALGLGAGDYVIGLTVADIPKYPPSMRSDLYEQNIKVYPKNNPPISKFSLGKSPIAYGLNEKATYSDQSYDPDGHPLINYSWKVERLDSSGAVEKTFVIGYPPEDFTEFGGIGKYKVTQTVFDEPPFPLPSLSGSSTIDFEVVLGPQRPIAEFTWTPDVVIAGNTISLDPSPSFDLDGTVVAWKWKITPPSGKGLSVTTSTAQFPTIPNAVEGTYTVQLDVVDNDGYQSEYPAIHQITVNPKPPNQKPIALFDWQPTYLLYGDTVSFNPDASYDLDGTVVGWSWTFKDSKGNITTSTERYPTFPTNSYKYEVTLVVRDNEGMLSDPYTQIVWVHPIIEPLVYHTPEWEKIRVREGRPFNVFYAGEKFLIKVDTSPAIGVEATVNFGGEIGRIDMTMGDFSGNSDGTVWDSSLWHPKFEDIPDGEYLFEFTSFHDAGDGLIITETDFYPVIIDDVVYTPLNYHRNY